MSVSTNVEFLDTVCTKRYDNPPKKSTELAKLNYMLPYAIMREYGLLGNTIQSTYACAAGAISIGEAYRLIAHGYQDYMIAGGADYSVTE